MKTQKKTLEIRPVENLAQREVIRRILDRIPEDYLPPEATLYAVSEQPGGKVGIKQVALYTEVPILWGYFSQVEYEYDKNYVSSTQEPRAFELFEPKVVYTISLQELRGEHLTPISQCQSYNSNEPDYQDNLVFPPQQEEESSMPRVDIDHHRRNAEILAEALLRTYPDIEPWLKMHFGEYLKKGEENKR